MAVERANSASSVIDVLDRVLDKGIVIDAWVRLSLVGIDLLTVEARIVVASIDTYLRFSEAVSHTLIGSRPTVETTATTYPKSTARSADASPGTAKRAPRIIPAVG